MGLVTEDVDAFLSPSHSLRESKKILIFVCSVPDTWQTLVGVRIDIPYSPMAGFRIRQGDLRV